MHLRKLLAVLACFTAFSAPARADIDYSDIWYEGAQRRAAGA